MDSSNSLVSICGYDPEEISSFTPAKLIETTLEAFNLPVEVRPQILFFLAARAKKLDLAKEYSALVKTYTKIEKEPEHGVDASYEELGLSTGSKGEVLDIISNYVRILHNDPFFGNVWYNEIKRNAVRRTPEGNLPWNDSELSSATDHIETHYKIKDRANLKDAFNIFISNKKYNPVKDLIEELEWDGTPRIHRFLIDIMKCEDCLYSEEVSRLIFAGGINRIYNPGCKFDYTPVLIGTKQGEGKSTIIRWLAMQDEYFTEVTTFDGKEGVECLEGAWICEVAELLAFKRAKEVEAVKSYLTRQTDKYRRAYAQCVDEFPRQCIFIATTNTETFLVDKSGNRRFLPIHVYSNGRTLHDNEAQIRQYIAQCWAEAKHLLDENSPKLALVHDIAIDAEVTTKQLEAVEDDYREGLIQAYLERKHVGDFVCVKELWERAIFADTAFPPFLTRKDSCEIGSMMTHYHDWEKTVSTRIQGYGVQKAWVKTHDSLRDNLITQAIQKDSEGENF